MKKYWNDTAFVVKALNGRVGKGVIPTEGEEGKLLINDGFRLVMVNITRRPDEKRPFDVVLIGVHFGGIATEVIERIGVNLKALGQIDEKLCFSPGLSSHQSCYQSLFSTFMLVEREVRFRLEFVVFPE